MTDTRTSSVLVSKTSKRKDLTTIPQAIRTPCTTSSSCNLLYIPIDLLHSSIAPSKALSISFVLPPLYPTMLRQSLVRSSRASIVRPVSLGVQTRKAHAISNPTLANIEKRWESMPPQEQADLWMALRDRMKVNWAELTLQEKKAGMSAFTSKSIHAPYLNSNSHLSSSCEFCSA